VRAPTTGTAAQPLGVYVHVPFCERVCPYCDFAVVAARALAPEQERAFVAALEAELEQVCLELGPALEGRRLATVYLGGGTPSMLEPASIAAILGALRARFAGEPEEVTLELNPGRVEIARIPGYRRAGVDRVSVGVQALDDLVLKRLGRAHAADDARAGFAACMQAGFGSASADLIFGAPGQTLASLLAGVDELIAQGVPHVSAYALTVEPETPFARARARGRLELPGEQELFEMGEQLGAHLVAAGLERYEISSWARPGHRSRHNQRYWLREDVLGLGPSAASLIGSRRFQNSRTLARWQAAVGRGELAWEDDAELDPDAARREALYLGLRRIDGVELAGYARRYGAEPDRLFARELAELRTRELIELEAGALRLTDRGRRFADEVFLALVEPL
jgi:oxygen-independent coproporphyrinogen-3 oxidase